ncbi:hypothetical protein ebA2288 [Aromatoleum aromaticum EbN1]|uniref:SbsA Ig-like domain-containing protein n=1 Tax=Aromatoleum aromaticum (strain DSM 19018 / LMG 30748 / EbN1) TaxID=76114 RepID=Q5P5M3_AROAE|nr:Ig-like domain-containing protein [Aromatoleum aromaticum]CAI07389.1 hypothetical protein ebA2288 [Aromatoleum aromaticum EbN1]
MAKGIFRGLALGVTTSLLVACGGGGGGGGSDGGGNSPLVPNPAETLKLTFSADRTSLPLNIAGDAAAIGSPYTSTINLRSNYVAGGGPEGGNCWSAEFNIIGGAASGFLVPPLLAGATSGSTTFFTSSSSGNWNVLLTSTDKAGTVTIEVAVPNPDTATVTCNDDKIEIGARFAGTPISYIREQFQVAVGQATGKASQIRINRTGANFLQPQNSGGTTQLVVQAEVLDEAGQHVPDPASGTHNLYVAIVDTAGLADNSALLRAGGASGKWVLSSSTNGQAQFTLVSGGATGAVLVEVVTDRFDNNVDNGITERVVNMFSVSVVASVGTDPLAIATATDLPGAFESRAYTTLLTASGGVPPYTWSLVAGSSLPAGLRLSSDGVLSGTPAVSGTFRFALRVTDSATIAQSKMSEFSLSVVSSGGPLTIETTSLPKGVANVFYAAAVTAQGGGAPYAWSSTSLPAGLSIDTRTGIISGVPTAGGGFPIVVTVTDLAGVTVRSNLQLEIDGASGSGPGVDTTAPTLLFSIPAANATSVDRCSDVVVRFSEVIDPVTVTNVSMFVRQQGGTGHSMADTIKIDDRTFLLRQFGFCSGPYAPNTQYEIVLTNSIRDLAGNQLAQIVVPFGTGGTVDDTPPLLTTSIPAEGASDVSPNATISVLFNEAMDANTVIPAAFAVYEIDDFDGKNTQVLPSVTSLVADSDRRFTFAAKDPNATSPNSLEAKKYYRVVITSSLKDLAGNAFAGGSFEFRVGDVP